MWSAWRRPATPASTRLTGRRMRGKCRWDSVHDKVNRNLPRVETLHADPFFYLSRAPQAETIVWFRMHGSGSVILGIVNGSGQVGD
jgi:hypothetical protein